jgi:hypothetical protein
MQLAHRSTITLANEVACLGCDGNLATSKSERAGLERLAHALVLLYADSERAVQRVCLRLKVRSTRLDLVDQAKSDGLPGLSASFTSTSMAAAQLAVAQQQQVKVLTSTTFSICLSTAAMG